MQLCVNTQIPEVLGGLDGQAVYIDTEGSFMSKRIIEISNATINLLKNKQFRNCKIKHFWIKLSNSSKRFFF